MNHMEELRADLEKQDGYISRSLKTDRQEWAIGFLVERFYEAGRLFETGEQKEKDMKATIERYGYSGEEADVIVKHVNVTAAWIDRQSNAVKKIATNSIEDSLEYSRHMPPAPKV